MLVTSLGFLSWTSGRATAMDRQAIFCRKTLRSQRHHATFIDQGYCFNAGEWTFPRLSASRRIREQLCVRGCDGMGGV